jgi:hypothetical protein
LITESAPLTYHTKLAVTIMSLTSDRCLIDIFTLLPGLIVVLIKLPTPNPNRLQGVNITQASFLYYIFRVHNRQTARLRSRSLTGRAFSLVNETDVAHLLTRLHLHDTLVAVRLSIRPTDGSEVSRALGFTATRWPPLFVQLTHLLVGTRVAITGICVTSPITINHIQAGSQQQL